MTWTREMTFSPQVQTLQGLLTRAVGSHSSDPTFSNTKANTNTYSIRGNTGTGQIGRLFATATQMRAGFWLNHSGPSPSDTPRICSITLTGGSELHLIYDAGTSQVILYKDASPVATVSVPGALAATDTWTHISIFCEADATVGVYKFYVGGTEILSYTGNTGTGLEAFYALGPTATNNNWASNFYIDDWYIETGSGNTAGSAPAYKFLFSLPNAAGDDSGWSVFPSGANYAAVDESTFDSDTTYVYASSAAIQDLYNFTDITLPSGFGISKVKVCAFAKKTNAAVDSQLSMVTSDSSTDDVSTAQSITTGYVMYEGDFALDSDGDPWTQSSVNAAQFGIKSAGTF